MDEDLGGPAVLSRGHLLSGWSGAISERDRAWVTYSYRHAFQLAMAAGEAYFWAAVADGSVAGFHQALSVFGAATRAYDEATPRDLADAWCWMSRSHGYVAKRSSVMRKLYAAARARRCIDRVLSLDPGHAMARYVLARWYDEMPRVAGGSRQKARRYIDEAMGADPDSLMFRYASGKIHLRSGDTRAAVNDLEEVLMMMGRGVDDERRKREAEALLMSLLGQRATSADAASDGSPREATPTHDAPGSSRP